MILRLSWNQGMATYPKCSRIHSKGSPVTKQWLSRWIIYAIKLAFSSLGQLCPMGVRAHSTRGIASYWAWSSGVSIAEICAAVGWASPSTFARFYNLEIPASQAWSFLLNRLTLSHGNQYGRLPSSVRSWPSIELRGCTDLFGTITQGWVDLDEFNPLTFRRAPLYITWSLWAPLGV